MTSREKETIEQAREEFIAKTLILVMFFFWYLIFYYSWKTSCEDKWWDRWKYTGVLGGCLVKTKQWYVPEESFNINQLDVDIIGE